MKVNMKLNRSESPVRLVPLTGLVLLPFCLLAFLLSSCETDAYDKGEGEYSLLRAELADVHVDNDMKAVFFDTDDSERITIERPFTSRVFVTADSTYRLAMYYRTAGDARADVLSMSSVAVMRPHKMDSTEMKTDPVRFESLWMGQNRRYLNGSIYLMVGNVDDKDQPLQVVGAQSDTLMLNADGTRTLHLRLYHDQAGMSEYYSQRTYMSIPLEDIDADSVSLSINTYSGIITKIFKL